MNGAGITLLGLGPGDPGQVTREAWQVIQGSEEIWLRTAKHPVIDAFPMHVKIRSFDDLYENSDSFDAVYRQIVEQILKAGRTPEGVIYATPGHPFIAEFTGIEIARRARHDSIPIRIIEGMSFLEPIVTALEMDPLPYTSLVDALELASSHVPSFPPGSPAIIVQVYSRDVASEVKLTLMSHYPDEHPVRLIHAAGTSHELVEPLKLYEIDRSPNIGLLTAIYVPALDPSTSFEAFQEVIAQLRAPDGCPWDREQTHQTLRAGLLEEAYEVLDAIDADDPAAMREELGDLLLLIVMHTQIASEYGEFTMPEVIAGIHNKIVHRHPHVFGDLQLDASQDVLVNWERLKAREREADGKSDASIFAGIAQALPALMQADEYQQRAARVGFDWPEITGVWDKVREEIGEVESADSKEERSAELGDLLFAVVNLARWYQIDPESALREANRRFRKRFARIEESARDQGRQLSDLTLDEMEQIWQASKGA